ncbi:MAG: UDP-N-acetylmuramyl-tripeptide synthetase, partial [Rhodoferax sp.]|nr:UDP-N-acetylmuramyl-tripeptide synthetase [Actinomycetota bacterium]
MPTPAGLRPATATGSSLAALAAVARGVVDDAHLIPASRGSRLVTGVTLDSRAVRPGDLYAALPGASAHGADFTGQAAASGAVAVLTDEHGHRLGQAAGLPTLLCSAPRLVLGMVAAEVYGHPADALQVLGVTGTNGKTTTTFLLDAALRALGRVTGMIGTVETRVADRAEPSVRTTPEAPDLHRLLATMREQHVQVCSMEVSSQALAQHRVDGVVVDVAGFTSFSQDHLELHGDMATYLAAKALLFTPAHSRRGVVVIDDEGGRTVADRSGVPVTTVSGRRGAGADWTVTDRLPDGATTTFLLQHADGPRLSLRCPMPGDFNVMNTALAAVMLLAAGVEADDVVVGLAQAGGVPGRMQQVSLGAGPLAVVDSPHPPDAVGAALRALRPAVAAGAQHRDQATAGGDGGAQRPQRGAHRVGGGGVVDDGQG